MSCQVVDYQNTKRQRKNEEVREEAGRKGGSTKGNEERKEKRKKEEKGVGRTDHLEPVALPIYRYCFHFEHTNSPIP